MITENRTMSRATVESAVEAIEPAWEVTHVHPATGGHHLVSHVVAATPDGRRECVLKATPEGKDPVAGKEARIMAILGETTSIPIPVVFGVVDAHGDLPAPFFLMSSMPGETVHRTEMDALADGTIQSVARSVGEHLADLHAVRTMEGFGRIECERRKDVDGGRPQVDLGRLRVPDPETEWESYLRSSIDGVVAGLSEGRFADLVPEATAALEERLERLSGPHRPVVGHVDASFENLLVDREAGRATALLDWEFTLAVTPAYDLAFVTHSLAGGPWRMVPDTPDYESLVREALTEGYATAGSNDVVERFEAERECYDLLAHLHSACNFEDWFALNDASEETVEAAARGHRDVLHASL